MSWIRTKSRVSINERTYFDTNDNDEVINHNNETFTVSEDNKEDESDEEEDSDDEDGMKHLN